MRTPGPIVTLLVLTLLCLIAAGAYLYPRLPELAVQQAEVLLSDYGVQSIALEGPVVGVKDLQIEILKLQGELDGLAFNATLGGVQLSYNWRQLLSGHLGELVLDEVELVLEQLPGDSERSNTTIVIDQILPHALFQQLPLRSIEIRRLAMEHRGATRAPVSATGDLSLIEQRLRLQLSSLYLGNEINVHLQTGDADSPLSLDLNMAQSDSNILSLNAQLQRESAQQWQWDIAGKFEWEALPGWLQGAAKDAIPLDASAIEPLSMQGSSTLQAALQHPNILHTAPTGELQPMVQLSGSMQLGNTVSDLDYPPLIDSLQGDVRIALELESGRWSATFDTENLTAALYAEQLSMTAESLQWLGWPKIIPISLTGSGTVNASSAANGSWSAQLSDTQLTLGNTHSQLRIKGLQLDTTMASALKGNVDAAITASVETRLHKTQLPRMELALNHQGPLEQGDLKLQLGDTAESIRLLISGSGNLKTGSGRYLFDAYSMDLPYASTTVVPLLQKFDLLEQDMELQSGTFKLVSEIESRGFTPTHWRITSRVRAENLTGKLDEYSFSGLSLKADWRGVEQWQTVAPIELTISSLDVGFSITDLRATAALPQPTAATQPTVRIEDFSANLFGGRFYLPQAHTWDFSSPSNNLTLKAEHWQLSELVALQQDQQIDAQGELEGELPIILRDGRIIIDKGYLKATGTGGSIRYTPSEATEALAKSSPELGMAMDLLRDFRYEVLSSEVELDQAGNLLLGLSLGGRNPSQYDGRQVNFNINLEQNLDPLLQSLRLSDTLVEKIEGRLQ